MRRVLFCNIAYLPYYDTKLDTVEPQNGGAYVLNEYNQLHIEKIDPLAKNREYIDNVLVVFCAKPKDGHSVIVGWYKNATVYRHRPSYNGQAYNLCAQKGDCVLLPEHKRTFKALRAKPDGIGFGQSNLWYASGEKCRDYVEKVFDYIDSYAS